jgi:hypothetical protein
MNQIKHVPAKGAVVEAIDGKERDRHRGHLRRSDMLTIDGPPALAIIVSDPSGRWGTELSHPGGEELQQLVARRLGVLEIVVDTTPEVLGFAVVPVGIGYTSSSARWMLG